MPKKALLTIFTVRAFLRIATAELCLSLGLSLGLWAALAPARAETSLGASPAIAAQPPSALDEASASVNLNEPAMSEPENTQSHSPSALAESTAEIDIPEEILRNEIITEARSPLTGGPMSAAEYARLQAELAAPAGDPLVNNEIRYLFFLLEIRRAIKPIFPFF